MASVGTLPSSMATKQNNASICAEKLPEGINDMKIKDDKVEEPRFINKTWTDLASYLALTFEFCY